MTLLVSYLLKVIVCSGILFLYYHLALRNKFFHQWNRFYLLTAAVLSLVIPVVQITITHKLEEQNNSIQLLKVVGTANDYLDEVTIGTHHGSSPELWAVIGYAVISSVLLFSLILSLLKIFSIARKYGARLIMNIKFINTDVAGTPFSFFRYIFWNRDIDLQSENGQRIFEHELVHVREKHTLDKLLMEAIIILFWCNPFFWLIRRELKMIHEFIADQKAVGEHGAAAFATMILQASYSKQFNSITNQFFQTSIKRRLKMITKIQNPKLSYFSRIIALPVIALLVLAFTLRSKELFFIQLEKPFTVVIDAGHGYMANGEPNGARYKDVIEAELNLAIAKKIEQLNPNQQVKIILTRNGKDVVDLRQRVTVAQEAKADLFISIHVNAAPPEVLNNPVYASRHNEFEGMDITVSNKSTAYQLQSELFGSVLEKQLESIYKITPELQKRKGAWVLDQNVCPSVLLECGYITNDKDRQFISSEANQKLVAEGILNAIQQYAKAKESGSISITATHVEKDTIPAPRPLYIVDGKEFNSDIKTIDPKTIQSVNVLKGDAAIKLYGDKGKNGVIQITLNENNNTTINENNNITLNENGTGGTVKIKEKTNAQKPLYIVDGKEFTGEPNSINPNDIESINVLKGDAAIKQFGDKGKNGVVAITLNKKGATTQNNNVGTTEGGQQLDNGVFEKTETPSSVDKDTWGKFLNENLQPVIESVASNGARVGTYTTQVKFIIETDGTLSNASILKDPGFGIGDKILTFIYKSPKWEPATQNGIKVRSFHTQPITFVIAKS